MSRREVEQKADENAKKNEDAVSIEVYSEAEPFIALLRSERAYFTGPPEDSLLNNQVLMSHCKAVYPIIRGLLEEGMSFDEVLSDIVLNFQTDKYSFLIAQLWLWREKEAQLRIEVCKAIKHTYYEFMVAPFYDSETLTSFVGEQSEPFLSLNRKLTELLSTEELRSQYEAALTKKHDENFKKFLSENPAIISFFKKNMETIALLSKAFEQCAGRKKAPKIKALFSGDHLKLLCFLFDEKAQTRFVAQKNKKSKEEKKDMQEVLEGAFLRKGVLTVLHGIKFFYPTEYHELSMLFSQSISLTEKEQQFFQYLDNHPGLVCYLYNFHLQQLALFTSLYYGAGCNNKFFVAQFRTRSVTELGVDTCKEFSVNRT